ncbi:SAM-dependent methyltransferase [Actinoplanes sp. NPDC026619]|uniref:SAM-dependent methyltransferase n=1 Tax=Actinoplanes sp. NPDC026619 TaxID=3155798 RepID=UPI0034084FD6
MGDRQYDFDTSVAHPARVYDYWLGGKDNFEADRKAAEEVIAVRPSILYDIRANRQFLGRAVRWLAAEAGVRQFLDIGTGIPAAGNTHQVAQEVDPAARIVYVDNDPIVLVHARALLNGATAYVDGDLREPQPILATARETLDFGKPIAVLLIGVLHLISDEENPAAIIAQLMAAVPPGSYLAVTQPASDINAEQAAAGQQRYNSKVATKQTRRTRAETTRFFDGLALVEPGVEQIHRWRPAPGAELAREVSGWAAVGRKTE